MGEEAPNAPQWNGTVDDDHRPHGQGTMTYPPPPPPAGSEEEAEAPGDTFVGTMAHGVRQGRGRYTWASGAVFDGIYVDGRKHGQGTMTFPDKGEYTGSWLDDKPDGEGRYAYPSGDSYVGSWRQGKKHGTGTYHSAAQQCQFSGTWEEGALVRGKWVHHDGSVFAGEFSASLPVQGTHFFSRSGLLQSGVYSKQGRWQGEQPQVGAVEAVL